SAMIDGTKIMSKRCEKKSDFTLIDTTGLIAGEAGRALKIGKIRAVRPDYIIGVEREDELAHIIELVEGVRILKVKAPRAAKIRSMTERACYRKKKLEAYFKKSGTKEYVLYTKEAEFLYDRRPFIPGEGLFGEGTIIGLNNHHEETLSLGILKEMAEDSITFESPIRSIKKVHTVIFGDMTMP
ncbi:MAG: Clp1/GlmU family protein, partial [Nitrospirota bacterium]